MNYFKRLWFQLTRARQGSVPRSASELESLKPISFVDCEMTDVEELGFEIGQNNQPTKIHVNNKTTPIPGAKYTQYQGEEVSLDKLETIRFKLSRPNEFPLKDPAYCALSKDKDQFSINTGELQRLIDEVKHYRLNQAAAEQFDAIFYLLARDVIFFSTFDDRVKDYTEGFSMVIQVNDTFYTAAADAQEMDAQDAPILKDLFLRFGYCGIVAWVAIDRQQDPLPSLRTDKYHEAKQYLAIWKHITDNQST